ncbi:MAG: DsbA family protein [Pseudobdellovibrionaceae bacterium]
MKSLAILAFGFLASFSAFAKPLDSAFHVRGPENAPVTLIMFGDFQCPYCQRAEKVLAELTKQIPEDFKVVYRHYPWDFHAQAMPASKASECAGQQGKFWQMHDFFYSLQPGALVSTDMKETAQKLNLEMTAFETCYNQAATEEKVLSDMREAELLGLKVTPHFVLVGPAGLKKVSGSKTVEEMKSFILEMKNAQSIK